MKICQNRWLFSCQENENDKELFRNKTDTRRKKTHSKTGNKISKKEKEKRRH